MKPYQLWMAIGTIIARECRCSHYWSAIDGTMPAEIRGDVTDEEKFRILRRIEKEMFPVKELVGQAR